MSRVLWVSTSSSAEPAARPFSGGLLDRLQDAADGVALLLRVEPGERGRVGRAMTHELPAALSHLLDRFGKDLADLGVQGDRRLHAGFVEHIRDAPQTDPHPVFAPGVVVDVGQVIGGIGRDADAEGGIVVPDFHIGGEPDRQCVVAGPLEWLALGDEGVLIAFRPAYRLRRRLRVRRRGRQAQRHDAGASGEAEAVAEKRTTVAVDLCHGDVLPARFFRRVRRSYHEPRTGIRGSRSLRSADHARGPPPCGALTELGQGRRSAGTRHARKDRAPQRADQAL